MKITRGAWTLDLVSPASPSGRMNFREPPTSELRRILLPRLYEKPSNTGEPPRHEANHGSVHHRFAARTKPLVVLAHPPLLVDPRQRTLHHPPTRQHQEA